MANQPTSWTGYWAATVLAPFLVRPIAGSIMVTASSNPLDLFNFQVMIDERSTEVDQAAAKGGFGTPIPSSATQAFSVMQRISRDGAIADALRLIYTGPDQKYVDRYQLAYDNALKLLAAGDMPLPGIAGSGGPMPVWKGIPSAQIPACIGADSIGVPRDF